MIKNKYRVIGFPTKPASKGGPGSFQDRFEKEIIRRGWRVIYPEINISPEIVLVNGGTRKICWLLKSKIRGAKIIYRLGGISWLYKHNKKLTYIQKTRIKLKQRFNQLLQILFGDGIIFQSEFSREWLPKLGQCANLKNNVVIYNGVDIEMFKPHEENGLSEGISLICVEGNLDYSPYAISLINYLYNELVETEILTSIKLYGDFENPHSRDLLNTGIEYHGIIPRNEIQSVYRNSIFLSLDVNPACPNSVLEAMACGIPVAGFDTGSLNELVSDKAGVIVNYGGNQWNLDVPDFTLLKTGILKIINNYEFYSTNARQTAIKRFSIDDLAENYIKKFIELLD